MVDPDIKDIVQKLRIILLDIQQLSLMSQIAPGYKRKIIVTLRDIERDLERYGRLRRVIEEIEKNIQSNNYEEARNKLEELIDKVMVGGSR